MLLYLSLFTIGYLLFSGYLTFGHAILGITLGLVSLLLLPRDQVSQRKLLSIKQLVVIPRYLAVVAYDLLKGGLQVAYQVLHPALPINPRIVVLPAAEKSGLQAALDIHTISLTPGEIVIGLGPQGELITHCMLSEPELEILEQAEELRHEVIEPLIQDEGDEQG